jgi:hypothetical protein
MIAHQSNVKYENLHKVQTQRGKKNRQSRDTQSFCIETLAEIASRVSLGEILAAFFVSRSISSLLVWTPSTKEKKYHSRAIQEEEEDDDVKIRNLFLRIEF